MNKEQLVTLPLRSYIWDILGDDANGAMCSKVTKQSGLILEQALKDSQKWKVEWENKDGKELEYPILWRYSEWKSAAETYEKQKKYEHNRRIEMFILDENVTALARAIRRTIKVDIELAKTMAYPIIKAGNLEVIKVMGLDKIITKESEL